MNIDEKFNLWKKSMDDTELLAELENIKNDDDEKNSRFSKILKFGTAGLRAVMGAGSNRMNIYTVRLASQALANHLNANHAQSAVVISFDSRKNSKKFAVEVAKVMAANNIKAYITSELQPTPFLSFAVRNLKAKAGVMITASHNTPEYNGYKCYGADGAQMPENAASEVYKNMCSLNIFEDIKIMDFEKALGQSKICFVDEYVYKKYFECVLSQRINKVPLSNLKLVYTPLNGAGSKMVSKILKDSGLQNLHIVPEQKDPDENFTTCKYPNPELESSFLKAIALAHEKDADLIIATDPDADRIGVCVKNGSDFKLLTGNEIGVIIFHYIISQKKKMGLLSGNPVLIKTIVSTPMANAIAKSYGCEAIEVLTGFKNIASEILKLENNGEENRYVFGFEESNGYLLGTYARDKDAVSAALILCEIAAYCKQNDINILDYLDKLRQQYGYYSEKTLSFEFKNFDGIEKIKNIMQYLRENPNDFFKGLEISKYEDYLQFEKAADVLIFYLNDDIKIIARPSGTEPKIKFYVMVKCSNRGFSSEKIENIEQSINEALNNHVQNN